MPIKRSHRASIFSKEFTITCSFVHCCFILLIVSCGNFDLNSKRFLRIKTENCIVNQHSIWRINKLVSCDHKRKWVYPQVHFLMDAHLEIRRYTFFLLSSNNGNITIRNSLELYCACDWKFEQIDVFNSLTM